MVQLGFNRKPSLHPLFSGAGLFSKTRCAQIAHGAAGEAGLFPEGQSRESGGKTKWAMRRCFWWNSVLSENSNLVPNRMVDPPDLG